MTDELRVTLMLACFVALSVAMLLAVLSSDDDDAVY